MDIDPRTLRYLCAIVECGTYRAAAEALRVSQPMLSKNIYQIERKLGVKVLVRGRNGAVPTIFGERLIAWSKIIESDLSRAVQDIDDLKGSRTGHVRVGAVPPLATHLVPETIAQLKASHPGIVVSFKENFNIELIAQLQAGELDIVVGVIGIQPIAANTIEEELFTTPLAAFVGRKHPLARQRSVSLLELRKYPWVSPSGSSLAVNELTSLIGAARLEKFDVGIETDSFPAVRRLLQDGEHFALNTIEVFADEVRSGSIVAVHLKGAPIRWCFGLKRRRDAFETPAMRVFAEHTRKVVERLYPGGHLEVR